MSISKKLKPYIALADMIAESFAYSCEVIIHDLSVPQESVVYVSKGKITSRQVGQSFDHLVKEVLLSSDFENDYRANYIFELEDGEKIKSSTSLIRDENGEIIGAICVNFKIEAFYKMQAFLNRFLSEKEEVEKRVDSIESYENVNEIIDYLIDKSIGKINVSKMGRNQNIEVVEFLYDKGIFLTKKSVEKVANKLSVSPVTIYSYLDEIKKMNK